MTFDIRAEIELELLHLAPQFIEPFTNGPWTYAYVYMSSIKLHIRKRRCPHAHQQLLCERDTKWSVLDHVDAQRRHRNVAEANKRSFDGLVTRKRFWPVAMARKANTVCGRRLRANTFPAPPCID